MPHSAAARSPQGASLRVTDVEQMQIDIADGKTARPRGAGRGGATSGGKGAASRSVTTLHSIFSHALRHGMIEANPALGVRKFPDKKKKRRLSRQEIADLGHNSQGKLKDGSNINAHRLASYAGHRP